ncbi:MAG TPA: hypothetical protein VJO12_10220, partial [Stellaceae bacterium]|nr:hypothetical protein [Stellaceae bacterium]
MPKTILFVDDDDTVTAPAAPRSSRIARVDLSDRGYNIGWMSFLATHAGRVRWLALALCPLWLGGVPVAAEEPAARLHVPGIDAACRADADQRARTELRLQAVQWIEGPANPSA